MMQEERFQIAGIGEIRLRLVPTLAEVAEAEREKRARGFFLHLVRALLLEPAFSYRVWASLPEDALRPVAVRLAEANDLAALFRPKREKPFYNGFRNAWRMSRATHNEAAFQRAIALWKAHLAASLARAKAAYDRAAGTDRTTATRLAEAGFIVSPQVLARPDVQETAHADGPIGPALCALFPNEALRDLIDRWFDLPPFRARESFVRDAFSAFLRGEVALAIYGLLPQPEGVLWDVLFRWNPAEEALEELVGAQNRTFVTVEALIRELVSTLVGTAEPPFYRFVKFIAVTDDGSLNRHAVEHGASIAFGSRENALRLILFLDFVHFALGHLLPSARGSEDAR